MIFTQSSLRNGSAAVTLLGAIEDTGMVLLIHHMQKFRQSLTKTNMKPVLRTMCKREMYIAFIPRL